jgi:uncharacterized protein YuzE
VLSYIYETPSVLPPRKKEDEGAGSTEKEAETAIREPEYMKIEYSKDVDALYIRLREARISDSMDIEEGVTVDLDENGHIVGIEILDASEKIGLSDLVNISTENIPLERAASSR